jgi:membrane-bound serine protease (ClpP class)
MYIYVYHIEEGGKMRIVRTILTLLLLLLLPVQSALAADVWEVEFAGEVTPSQARWMTEVYEEALDQDVETILLVLNTPGGRIDAALEIGDTMGTVPTVVLVDGGAISAGSFIALAAEEYYMLEGSTIGAAEPRIGMEKADEKTVSYWSAQLAAMAERNGRDPQIARAMSDEDVAIVDLVEPGKLLTLTANEAQMYDMTDGVYRTKAEFLVDNDLTIVHTVAKEPSEVLADLLTSSVVSTILLMIGLAGIFIEVFTPGFGVPGAIGFVSLGLYFGGSMLAGLSGWEAVFFFMLGLVLIIIEVFFIPGFGVAGVAGFIAIFASIFVAAPDATTAIQSIVVALIGAIIIIVLLIRVLPTKHAFSRLILSKGTDTESGYVAISPELKELEGKNGVTVSHMRPAGTVRIDGKLVDALTQGAYLTADTPIKVLKVVGGRVIVEKNEKENE